MLPKAELGEYKGLEVARREPEVADEQIQQEIEAMRERLARLRPPSAPPRAGDFVVVDYVGSIAAVAGEDGATASSGCEPFAGGEGRDQLVELGAGNLIPGFEEGLLGAGAGETRTVALTFPADYGDQELAGREASFEITVKEVKLKELPDVDEDFAIDAGFDDLEELREDIRGRLLEADEARIEAEFRQAALDAAVAARAAWRSRPSWSRRGARGDVGADAALALATAASRARPTCRSSGARRPTSSPRWARSRARAAPRGRAHGGRRRRGHRALRGGAARGARADRRARGDRAAEAARAAARRGTPGGGARGSRGARRRST